MKKSIKKLAFLTAAVSGLFLISCGPSTHVSVGVGVHVPGAWGPYPGGGSVWVGTPVYPPYYYPAKPADDDNREFVMQGLMEFEAEPAVSRENYKP